MAKFTRFDPKNKKKGKHKFSSKEHEGPRIKKAEVKRKVKINFDKYMVDDYDYIDRTEDI
jgi:hypothetical protein